jgi:large repetitive protein
VVDEIPELLELTFVGPDPVVNSTEGPPPDSVSWNPGTRELTLGWTDLPFSPTPEELEVEIPVEISPTVGQEGEFVNEASLVWTSLPGVPATAPNQPAASGIQSDYHDNSTERSYDPNNPADIYLVTSSATLTTPSLPRTGFAPGEVTLLPLQPTDMRYAPLGDFWIEISKLDVQIPIVGVPFGDQGWNLTWLGDQAGYLEGTAYPTHAGNSAITAHTYLPDGQAGPFVDLRTLTYGDRIVVHMGTQLYYYEVRENRRVGPGNLSVLKHEDYPWLTLITCEEYSAGLDDYRYRRVVRAVLVKIESEDSR